ncbi:transient receptor potential cation channel protein painless-like [Anopheles aquasalis]|uniref:transient receptor potential cation channel protein painless-like n=1 Tax=Anopheles aquasalis TaxID=42839 RepID=UPI00215A6478|nr:transient receptor potential cation channel protein painless-like [Anopheles aquasalis]
MQLDLFYTILDLCYRTKNEKLFNFISEKKPNNHAALSRLLKTQTTLFIKEDSIFSFDKLVDEFLDSIEELYDKSERHCTGRTALFYAIIRRNELAQQQLLAKGAYLGARDFRGQSPICNVNLELLEKHLDSCVKANELNDDGEESVFTIDLSNFFPKENDQMYQAESKLYPLVQLADRLTSNNILNHPVVASIVTLKRYDLRLFIILYFVYHFMHLVGLMITLGNDSEPVIGFISVIYYLLVRFIICFSIEMKISNVHWAKIFLQVAMIIQLFFILIFVLVKFLPEDAKVVHRVIPAIGLLLIAIEFTLVLVKFPWLSCASNIIMITTVLVSYCKSLLPFSPLLTGFALVFHKLFKTDLSDKTDDQLNPFETCQAAILKTIVMTTGEFDTSNIKPQESWEKYIFFLFFLLFVYTPFSNFISGLAVDDTTKLRADADIITFQKEISLLYRLESINLW